MTTPLPQTPFAESPSIDAIALDESLASMRRAIIDDSCSRWCSWQHCYDYIHAWRHHGVGDDDGAALHLGFYLASWGMFRNSGLLEKSHHIYLPIIRRLARPDAVPLWQALEVEDSVVIGSIAAVSLDIASHLEQHKVTPTATLLSKILLGTTACVPAFDLQTMEMLRSLHSENWFPSSIRALKPPYLDWLFRFCRANEQLLRSRAPEYPPMKTLDVYLWTVGGKMLEAKKARKNNKSLEASI